MQRFSLLVIFLCLGLCACAGPVTMGPQADSAAIRRESLMQREFQFRRAVDDQARVYNMAFQVMTANAPSCGHDVSPHHGLALWNLESIAQDSRPAARALYGVDHLLSVRMTASNSPADRAGLRQGDIIVSINGVPVPPENPALKTARKLPEQAQYRDSQIFFRRGAEIKSTVLRPLPACAWPVILSDSPEINASTDGDKIAVTRGILRFAGRDDELALVIAHELAHNTMGHLDKRRQNAIVGTLGGLAIDAVLGATGVATGNEFSRLGGEIGGMAYSVEFEQEADYVAMYFMERAGYNSAGVADFWRRLAAEDDSAIKARISHPASPERFLAIEATHREILEKKARGLPLSPNLRTQ